MARPTFAVRGERWGVVGDLWRRAEIAGHDAVWHRGDDSGRPHFYGRFAAAAAGARVSDSYFRGHDTARGAAIVQRGVGGRPTPPLTGVTGRPKVQRPTGGTVRTNVIVRRPAAVTSGTPPPNRPATAFNRIAPAHPTQVISRRGQNSRAVAGHGSGSPAAPQRAPTIARTTPSTPRPSVFHTGDSPNVQRASQRGANSRTITRTPAPRK